jgi:RNA polymerase sigma-70 factor, ECF subfamily
VAAGPTSSTLPDGALFEAARGGDQEAFGRLIEAHRGELHAHCYRMLGSVHDAEDALQDALLRAWRGLSKVKDARALRAWLYKIATNASLDAIGRRPKRVLPIDYGPSVDPHDGLGLPPAESTWVEPYPDQGLGLEDGLAGPEARYELRESVELAFVAALQHLPANQRAALVLREVLGFSAQETAEQLDTTVASVNSALQRARQTVDERLPDESQQATLRALGDERLREVVDGYMDAMGRGDVDAMIGMLAEDAAWSMPPLAAWFRGHEALRGFMEFGPLSGEWDWRHRPTRASGQPAIGSYAWYEEEGCYRPFALDVMTLEGDKIKDVTSFITRSTASRELEDYLRYPEQPFEDDSQILASFERFGLPDRLER